MHGWNVEKAIAEWSGVKMKNPISAKTWRNRMRCFSRESTAGFGSFATGKIKHQRTISGSSAASCFMEISNCTSDDADAILNLYAAARELQIARQMVVWPIFEKSFIEAEIREQRQWKITIDGSIACNWAVAYADPDIWEEKDQADAIYIHRIATHPNFRGRQLVKNLVTWAAEHARQHHRTYVRLDTLGMNTKLIEHYTAAGFTFLGVVELKNTQHLPEHYQRESQCLLFELEV